MTTMAQHQSVGSAAPDDDDDEWFAGVREQYDGVADAYDLADRTPVKLVVMGPSVLGALRSELRRSTLAGTTGVDLACGTGFLTRLLAADGARVIGIDISPQMIERARANRHERIEYRVGDVYQLDAAQLRASTAEGFDFVAMGRALLAEPDLLNRIKADRSVRSICNHCNKCMPTIYSHTHCVLTGAPDNYQPSAANRGST